MTIVQIFARIRELIVGWSVGALIGLLIVKLFD